MIGSLEIFVVLVAALFIFGPDKLPKLAHAVGKAFGDFRKAQLSTELGVSGLDVYSRNEKQKDTDRKIKEIASAAGIDVQGKSIDELLTLIEENVKN